MFLLTLALLIPADAPKDTPKGVPANLKGEWRLTAAAQEKRFGLSPPGANLILKIGDNSLEWEWITYFSEEPGKATLVAQGKENEGTLELKLGDKVYKGIYRLKEDKENKITILEILLGLEGKAAPKEFHKDPLKVPADASYLLKCDRKKK